MVMARIAAPRGAIAAAVLAATTLAGRTDAATFDYQAHLGAGHTDNVYRTEVTEESESFALAGTQFSLLQNGTRLDTDVVANLAYVEYLDNAADSEITGNLAGLLTYAFVPERFVWSVSDNFGQVLSQPFQPSSPGNREYINTFATGPDFTMAVGTQTRLRLTGRYGVTSYEDSPFDSDTTSGHLSLLRQVSASSTLSLTGGMRSFSYDEASFDADYEQREVYLGWTARGARTHLNLAVGYNEVERDADPDKDSGMLLRLDASRRISSSSTATLTAGREFANSATAFASGQSVAGVGIGATPGLQSPDPFTRDYVTLGWDFSRERTSLGLFASWEQNSYDTNSAFDQSLGSVGFSVQRRMSMATSLIVDAAFGTGEFEQTGSYDDLSGGLGFNWQMSRSLSMTFRYDYFTRDSELVLGDYNENRYMLTFAYGRGVPRSQFSAPAFAVDQGQGQ